MNIGIILKDLENSQLNYDVIQSANKLRNDHSICILYRNLTKCTFKCNFAFINYNKIFSSYFDQDSLLISTDIDSTLDLISAKNAANKIFYAYNLDFLQNNEFDRNYKAYNSMPVFTRSESYKQAIKNYANVTARVEKFDLERLLKSYYGY
jgi:hypothetical protein